MGGGDLLLIGIWTVCILTANGRFRRCNQGPVLIDARICMNVRFRARSERLDKNLDGRTADCLSSARRPALAPSGPKADRQESPIFPMPVRAGGGETRAVAESHRRPNDGHAQKPEDVHRLSARRTFSAGSTREPGALRNSERCHMAGSAMWRSVPRNAPGTPAVPG